MQLRFRPGEIGQPLVAGSDLLPEALAAIATVLVFAAIVYLILKLRRRGPGPGR